MEDFIYFLHLIYTAITLDKHHHPHVTDKETEV